MNDFVNFHFFSLPYHQVSQFKRGGLSLCLYDQDVADAFRQLIIRDNAATPAKQQNTKPRESALGQLDMEKKDIKLGKRTLDENDQKQKTCKNEMKKEKCELKKLT